MAITGDLVTGQPVSFKRLRQLLMDQGGGVQEGAVGATDFKVSQRAAGANMSVDVAAGKAWVQIDTGTNNGLSHVLSDAIANQAVAASHATLPRIDQVVLQYNDTSIPAGVGGDTPTIRVVGGVATAGATLDNRTGAAALPADALLLADVLVPAVSSTVVTANIRDRRKWARGGYNRIVRTAGDLVTASTSPAQISTTLQVRLECSGVPVRLKLRGRWQNGTASIRNVLSPRVDSAADASVADFYTANAPSASADIPLNAEYEFIPSTGSHLLEFYWWVSGASSAVLSASATSPAVFTVEEIVRQNANNT